MSPFTVLAVSGGYFHFNCILHGNFCKQNSVESDQMPHFVVAKQSLHCFHMSPEWISSLKKAKEDNPASPSKHFKICTYSHIWDKGRSFYVTFKTEITTHKWNKVDRTKGSPFSYYY